MLYATTLDGEPDNTVYFWDFPGNIPVEEVRTYLNAVSYQILFETPYVKWHETSPYIRSIGTGACVEPDFFLSSESRSDAPIAVVRGPGGWDSLYFLVGDPALASRVIERTESWEEAMFAAVGPNIAKVLFTYWADQGCLEPGTLEFLIKAEWERWRSARYRDRTLDDSSAPSQNGP